MREVRKFNVIRSLLIGSLALSGGSHAYALYNDRSTGSLLDEQGVVNDAFIE